MANQNQINVKDFMIGASIGLALGATIALLTAPKSGKEVRVDINKGIDYVKDQSQKMVLGVKTQSNEVVGKIAEVKSKVQSKFTEIKENSAEGITEIKLQEEQQAEEQEDSDTHN